MKIAAHLEFDTFAEAERVFRHLEVLDAPQPAHEPHPKKTNGAHAPQEAKQYAATEPHATAQAEQPPGEQPRVEQPAAGGATLDDLKDAFRAYLDKKGGRTALTARSVLEKHGGITTGRLGDVPPEKIAATVAAFKLAGPENPTGDVA